ncbi:MAG: glycine--tRNA ligase [Chloroflexi bacterium]|nr:glycine--tRNA ligase [Chloroflexota bacterium]
MTEQQNPTTMEQIISLCRRRGFIFQSSEIYGGLGSCWDYGPLGIEFKNNIKKAWWKANVQMRGDMVGIDCSILMHPQVWISSGHVAGFSDPLVDCKQCKQRFRHDTLQTAVCPDCGGELTEPRQFNLMFKTHVGAVEESASVVYLRPETAQGIFVNFDNVVNSTRKKVPFGIAQIGKSFRNEITRGDFIFRCREFEQMEIEFFVKPGADEEWHEKWLQKRMNFYLDLGVNPAHLHFREHEKAELAHYAKRCVDIEYLFPMGWRELEGIANRADFDLTQHAQGSSKDLSYFDGQERFTPYVIEPSAGVERSFLTFMIDAYREEEVNGEVRTWLKLHPDLVPYKIAVLPLSKKEELNTVAQDIFKRLSKHWACEYDETQSIGRRYRRQDEIGTLYCITVDFDSLQDNAVTIRYRDTMQQIRIPIDKLENVILNKLNGEVFSTFE